MLKRAALLWLLCFGVYAATLGLHAFDSSEYASDEAHYLLPSIDIGIGMNGKDGRVTEQVVDFARYSLDEPIPYAPGTWGPKEADALLRGVATWSNPWMP